MKKAIFFLFSILAHSLASQTASITAPSIPDQGVIYEVSVKNSLIDFSTSGDWDFSQITTNSNSSIEFALVSDSQYSNNYPNATHVKYEDGQQFFLGFDASASSYHGERTVINTAYDTPLLLFPYPFSVGDTSSDQILDVPFTCTGCPPALERNHEVEFTALSSGSVTMPDGSVYDNVVLVQTVQNFTDGQIGSPPCLNELQAWEWWAEGFATPLVRTSVITQSGQCPPGSNSVTKFITGVTLNSTDNQYNNPDLTLVSLPNNHFEVLLSTPSNQKGMVSVFNMLGQNIKRVGLEQPTAHTYKTVIDMSGYAPGVYLVKASLDGSGMEKTARIIVK